MTELKETVELMLSKEYKDRFIAEYAQLKIRYNKLLNMVEQWDKGILPFVPSCPRSMYDIQLRSMKEYMSTLEARAIIERVNLKEI